MAIIFGAPSRYIQGQGEIHNIGKYVSRLGSDALCIISEGGLARNGEDIRESFEKTSASVQFEVFGGECSHKEIDRITALVKGAKDVVIGFGGGKIIDTAKAAAFKASVPVVICPTIASSDAPCSSVSVVYTEDGVTEDAIFMPTNPDVVLIDSDIVAKSPLRMTVAGIGDALATYIEVRACMESDSPSCLGSKISTLAAGIAKLCYDTVLEYGLQACEDIRNGMCTNAVEKIIEANTLLSGLGFESGGLSCAHAVHNGLTTLDETHHMQHGEKVNFGTVVQLVVEERMDELEKLLPWMVEVGLPVTLEELGVVDLSYSHLQSVCVAVCQDVMIDHMNKKLGPADIYEGFLKAEQLGRLALSNRE